MYLYTHHYHQISGVSDNSGYKVLAFHMVNPSPSPYSETAYGSLSTARNSHCALSRVKNSPIIHNFPQVWL